MGASSGGPRHLPQQVGEECLALVREEGPPQQGGRSGSAAMLGSRYER
jgi:hypothetical protein